MNTDMLRRTARTIALAVCLALVWQGNAQAMLIFDYRGYDYSIINGTDYDYDMSITGSFELESPVDPLTYDGSLSLTGPVSSPWSFSDGVNTLDHSNASLSIFELALSFSGGMISVDSWNIEALGIGTTISTKIRTSSAQLTDDECYASNLAFDCAERWAGSPAGDPVSAAGMVPFLAGSDRERWSVSIREATSVPEPSALLLFATGLLGVGYVTRRRPAA